MLSFLSISLLFVTELHASLMTPWKQSSALKCSKEFDTLATSFSLQSEPFRESIPDSFDEKVYRNLPTQIGAWREVHIKEGQAPYLFVVDDEKIVKHSFSDECKVISENVQWPLILSRVFDVQMPEDWKNEELKNLVSTNKKGIIYSWSPKFVYSVEQLSHVEKFARKLGYEFTAVVDPRSSRAEVMNSLEKVYPKKEFARLRVISSETSKSLFLRNTSIDLYMRGAFNHFPVTYVYNKGKIHSRFITGVMTDKGFKEMAETLAGEL